MVRSPSSPPTPWYNYSAKGVKYCRDRISPQPIIKDFPLFPLFCPFWWLFGDCQMTFSYRKVIVCIQNISIKTPQTLPTSKRNIVQKLKTIIQVKKWIWEKEKWLLYVSKNKLLILRNRLSVTTKGSIASPYLLRSI